ncbi:MAG: helix-turn-helix transcriptional regulator [Caldilineaceae bacterium]|nr:helix-turn-helix transcriptional regulator [Caldilineaceae bacterium]
MHPTEEIIERGTGNVFADLGRPDAEAHLLKAQLVTRIEKIIRQRKLKQVEAAAILGLSQPDVSRLLRGNFREYSVERLLRLLTALGRDIEIVVHEPDSTTGDEAAAQLTPQRQGTLSVASIKDSGSTATSRPIPAPATRLLMEAPPSAYIDRYRPQAVTRKRGSVVKLRRARAKGVILSDKKEKRRLGRKKYTVVGHQRGSTQRPVSTKA